MFMTVEERAIRFGVALEIIQDVYSDYCKDNSKTREQAGDFCEFVISMQEFHNKLKNEK